MHTLLNNIMNIVYRLLELIETVLIKTLLFGNCPIDAHTNTQILNATIFFFFIRVFFHDHSRITGLQGNGDGISLTPHYHFYPFHRHLENSPLDIGSSRTRTGNQVSERTSLTTKLRAFIYPEYILTTKKFDESLFHL